MVGLTYAAKAYDSGRLDNVMVDWRTFEAAFQLTCGESVGFSNSQVGGCQNYGHFLGTLNIKCRIIIGTQKKGP